MADKKNSSKKLDKNDHAGMSTAAKVVKCIGGGVATALAFVFGRKFIDDNKNTSKRS